MDKAKKIIVRAHQDVLKLNEEFEEMSDRNKETSSSIKSSIAMKSKNINSRKRQRAKHFESIRSKSR